MLEILLFIILLFKLTTILLYLTVLFYFILQGLPKSSENPQK